MHSTIRKSTHESACDEVRNWCQMPGEVRVVITTLSGSAYVSQVRPGGTAFGMRQLIGDSLERVTGLGMFASDMLVCSEAFSDVYTRQIHMHLHDREGDSFRVITSAVQEASAV